MNRVTKTIISMVAGVAIIVGISAGMTQAVYADEAADLAAAQALQLQLLMQTPEYQAALKAQQEALQAQQALQQQQAQLALQAQAAALAQYQEAYKKQCELSQLAFNNAIYLQNMAQSQAFLLGITQAQQRAAYENMIVSQGLDYRNMLMKNFTDTQNQALKSFLGYNGL